MSPLMIALFLAGPAQAGEGIALRGGTWEVLCTGTEFLEISWFDDPATAWSYVQDECGGISKITGMELQVESGGPEDGSRRPALFLARNGMGYWPGQNGELLMADMDGVAGNFSPERTGTGQALDTFVMGPTQTERVGPGQVLLVLDTELFDEVLAQFGPCAPDLGASCEGRASLRTLGDMAGLKLAVQPDARWIRAQALPTRLQWAGNPHDAWLSPPVMMDGIERPPGNEHADLIALEEAVAVSHVDGWAGMVQEP